jgi:3-methyl-2-oxobutanoate hydroxymethyltransferase
MVTASPQEKAAAIRGMKAAGRKISILTAYDYPMARMLEEARIDVILVGDSLGMVVLGFPDTTSVTIEHMLHHIAAVRRGAPDTFIVGDLPIGSYTTPESALASSRRLMDAGATSVKLEGAHCEAIRAITDAGIPLMAHLGMLPQHVREEGGYRLKGRTDEESAVLVEQARAVESAGAFAVVLELVKPETASLISQTVTIPTIGIGSGKGCDGQVLVIHDLIGLFPWFRPKFVKPEADVSVAIRDAIRAYQARTGSE